MKISRIQIEEVKRLDPEFFYHDTVAYKDYSKLSDIACLTVGKTPQKIVDGSIPFYRVGDIKKFFLKIPKLKISKGSLSKKFLARKGDILISTKGRVGDAAVVNVAGFYNQDLTCMRPKRLDPEVLAVILNNSKTQNFMLKYGSNQMHPFVRLSSLKKIPITIPNAQECQKIRRLYKKLVLTQTRIDKIKNEIDLSFTCNDRERSEVLKSELLNTKRLDPEFYSTYKSKSTRLKDLRKVFIKIGSHKNNFVNIGTPYLRSHNLENPESITQFVKAQDHEISEKGEVLLTRVGTTKAVYITNEKYVPSDNFIRISIDSKELDSQIVCEYFNSVTGQKELSKFMQGSQQKRLNKRTVLELPLPKIDQKTQEKFKKLIQEKERKIKEGKKIISILVRPTFQL